MSERISYADEHGNFGAKPVLLLDRVLGAALAFFGGIATITFAPIILGVGWPGLPAFQHPYFSWRLWALLAWAALWLIPAIAVGWIAGFPRVLAVFSHLWFTADPPNRLLSLQLWVGIFVISVMTSFASLPW